MNRRDEGRGNREQGTARFFLIYFRAVAVCLSLSLHPSSLIPAAAGGAGTAGGRFLELGSPPRSAAMGETSAASATGADAVRLNPAALTRVEEHSLSLMHVSHLEDAALEHGAFATRLEGETAIGASVLMMNYGSIGKTDATGAPIGSARPSDLALTAAYAWRLDTGGALRGSSLGFSLSYVQSKIVASAETFTGSVGFLSRPLGRGGWRLAAVGDNLFGALKFDLKSDPLPMTFRLGTAGKAAGLGLAVEAVLPRDADAYPALGVERWFGSAFDRGIALRVGFNGRSSADLDGMAGLSAGLGFAMGSAQVDYAFVPFGDLGIAHRMALNFRFGSGESRDESRAQRPVEEPKAPAGPPSPKSERPTVQSLRLAGSAALKSGDMETAKERYREAIALGQRQGGTPPGYVDAYLGLAWCQEKEGNVVAARNTYEKALTLTTDPATKERIRQKISQLPRPSRGRGL